jgi:hypothetical protein
MPPRAAEIHHPMIPRRLAARIGCKTKDDGVKDVDVATHGSKRSVAFDQNGCRRGRFSVDRATLPIARGLLGRRYHHWASWPGRRRSGGFYVQAFDFGLLCQTERVRRIGPGDESIRTCRLSGLDHRSVVLRSERIRFVVDNVKVATQSARTARAWCSALRRCVFHSRPHFPSSLPAPCYRATSPST